MRLWPFRARATTTPELQPVDEQPEQPYGASGTINQDGLLVPSDYNPELSGPEAIETWERMRRSDPSVRETLGHIYSPIKNADWSVQPPEDPDDTDLEIAAFARAALFEWPHQPWEELLTQILTFLPMGYSLFETVFMVVERELEVKEIDTGDAGGDATDAPVGGSANGNGHVPGAFPPPGGGAPPPLPPEVNPPRVRMVPKRQFLTWEKLSHRLPETITHWRQDTRGNLLWIKQHVGVPQEDGSMFYEDRRMPAQNVVLFIHEKEGDEWTGMSLLRSAYKPWVFKEMTEKVAAIAYERFGAGILVGYLPRSKEGDDVALDRLEEILRDVRAGEFSYMVFPGPKAQGNIDGYFVEILCPPGAFPDFEKILTHWRGDIKGSVLARFSELGHQQTGARAVANVQSEVWYDALHFLANYVAAVLNRALRRLIDMNYPNVTRYPELKVSDIEARSLLEFAQAVALLGNAGFIVADTPTRAWVRDSVDAPVEDPEEAQLRAESEREAAEFERNLEVMQVEEKPEETARSRVPDQT